jgi:RNA polymerase subunit RPABC4/transcription elongation factor Spt4
MSETSFDNCRDLSRSPGARADFRFELRCQRCGAETRGARSCPECGYKMVAKLKCGACSAVIEPGARFCPECGQKQ